MSKLDMLHSLLISRVSAVIRDVFKDLEVTVKDFQEETVRTRAENAKLKRQLNDVWIRTQTRLNGEVHSISQNVPEEVFPARQPACGSASQMETEEQETQKRYTKGQSPDSFRDEKPCTHDFKDREELRHLAQERTPIISHSPTDDHLDSQSMDEVKNINLPSLETDRIKREQEDTIITITSSVITSPANAGQCQGSVISHHLRTDCNTSTTLKKTQRKGMVSARILDNPHSVGPYKCNKCGRYLKDLSKLQLHKKLHERSFSCHLCGRDFSKFEYLRMHMRTHTGERPYRCNWCSKTFTQCGNMRRHERTCKRFTEGMCSRRKIAV